MQVMTCAIGNSAGFSVGAVAFDMDGRIADPHELLQAEDCWLSGEAVGGIATIELLDRFTRFAKARLGKKGGHWGVSFSLNAMRSQYGLSMTDVPWSYAQERSTETLMALMQKLAPVKLPEMDTTGLIPGRLLHDAVRQAVIVQAAFRALGLSAGDHARAERSNASTS